MAFAPQTFARKLLQSFGLDVRRVSFATRFSIRLASALKHADVNLVLDVGANRGQFAAELRHDGYGGRMLSFEPLSSAHAALSKAAHSDSLWTVHDRTAVGDSHGDVTINISANSVSSSLLPIGQDHLDAHQDSRYIATETVPLRTLDELVPPFLQGDDRVFMKIDTQGFEWQVLDGAAETLKQTQGVLLEASMTELYEGQRLWLDLIDRMQSSGFAVWAIERGFTNRQTGRMLQCDIVFLRQHLANSGS